MSTASERGILCAGRLYCDLVFTGVPNLPRLGEETFAQGLTSHAGGGAFITAATIRALGCKASVFATLPEAPFDQVVRRDMVATGITSELCATATPGQGPQVTAATVLNGDRSFLTHNAGTALPATALPVGAWQHLHIGELRTLVDYPGLVDQARTAGMTLSVDCGWDESLLHQGTTVSDLLAGVDVFLPNEMEYEALTASGCRESSATLVVVKRGDKGASALQAGTWVHHPGTTAEVVDTTGAGDAFNGGFLVSWLAGEPLNTCLAVGNCCGAASVRSVGGTSGLSGLQNDLQAVLAGLVADAK